MLALLISVVYLCTVCYYERKVSDYIKLVNYHRVNMEQDLQLTDQLNELRVENAALLDEITRFKAMEKL